MKLTERGKIVVAVFWTAVITSLLIWWGQVVAQHDRAILHQCLTNQYECAHPDTWEPGSYIPDDKGGER